MSILHEELEIALWPLEDQPLGSAGLTFAISNLLSRVEVYHQCRVGYVKDPLWQDSWHYLIFNQLGGSGVDSASLFRRT